MTPASGIPLSTLLPIIQPSEFKVHLACWNGEKRPLDVFVDNREEWDGWNAWRSGKDDFNRPYILSLIDFYPESDTWLFGGVYRVLDRKSENWARSYTVEAVPDFQALTGRVKVRFRRPSRTRAVRLESFLPMMTVSEVLKELYSGQRFPGYEDVSIDLSLLKVIVDNQRPDWRAALENVKGVYLIVDRTNGKKYVGAAYGGVGIWSRWKSYVETGHGWNVQLKGLIGSQGFQYALQNFQLTLLEYRPARTDDKEILEREGFWKRALLTQEFGYNSN